MGWDGVCSIYKSFETAGSYYEKLNMLKAPVAGNPTSEYDVAPLPEEPSKRREESLKVVLKRKSH